MNNNSLIIGIDLGTTNCCVSVKKNSEDKPIVIPNSLGYNTTPSYVAIDKDGSFVIGQSAKRQVLLGNVVYEAKRLIGRKFVDKEIKNCKDLLSYSIIAASNGDAAISLNDKIYNPIEIASKILSKLKQDAENFLNEKITRAVITVPAYFNDNQRQATKQAGEAAGLTVERIINEPTAAALAYGFDKEVNQKVVVYDLGGGTFDVSILAIENGTFEVLSTNGDTFLGGANFDEIIMKHLIAECEKKHAVKINLTNKQVMQRFKDEAEKAKIELSSTMEYSINMPYLETSTGPVNFSLDLSRAKVESLVMSLVENSLKPCQQALKDANLSVNDINAVILVGGMTRMPLVQKKVKDFFGKETYKGVNPDEVVAVGAAIQGAVLRGDVSGVLLLDVTPLTLGIETAGGVMTALIEKNTTIPVKKSQVFSTAADNQTQVTIMVYQGERSMAADNHLLGQFNLDGIPPAKRGVPQIEVTFDIDSNGILNVAAKDKGTGKEQKVQIQSGGGLTKDQIEKMKKEAEMYAEQDKIKAKLVTIKNEADQTILSAEDNMKEHGEKLEESDREKINKSLENLKSVKDSDDVNKIEEAINELKKDLMKLGEIMYKNQQNNSQNPENNNT